LTNACRRELEEDDEQQLQVEIDILSQLDHPNVLKILEIFDEPDCIYLVLELLKGGELFDRIVEKESYSEKEAAETVRPLVDAIRYCHSLGIIHRDLKPENLLYATADDHAIIKITDFGLARFVENELATTACGTPNYVAPEIIAGKGYSKEVDLWSIGVIIYTLIIGKPPFETSDVKTTYKRIRMNAYNFPDTGTISDSARDLITKILNNDPTKRPTVDEILQHEWMNNHGSIPRLLPASTLACPPSSTYIRQFLPQSGQN